MRSPNAKPINSQEGPHQQPEGGRSLGPPLPQLQGEFSCCGAIPGCQVDVDPQLSLSEYHGLLIGLITWLGQSDSIDRIIAASNRDVCSPIRLKVAAGHRAQ